MELDAKLCSDTLLKDFFNQYLQLEVWPVGLYYDEYTGVVLERCQALGHQRVRRRRIDPSLRYSLLEWTLQRRWNSFLKSRLYFEYRLCCVLNGARPTSPVKPVMHPRSSSHYGQSSISGHASRKKAESVSEANNSNGHDSVMSSALPDELWSDGEGPVAMETYSDATTQPARGLSCRQMSKLKTCLAGTMGVTLIDLWVQLEVWQMVGDDGCGWWAGLRNLRKTYYSICQSERGVGGRVRLAEGNEWMTEAQEQCIHKLTSYWIPRFNSTLTNNPVLSLQTVKGVEPMESCDPSLPFVQGLRCNALAGSPFQDYLTREALDVAKLQLELWEACDKVLTHRFTSSNQQMLRGCWNVWTVVHHQMQGHAHKQGASDLGTGRCEIVYQTTTNKDGKDGGAMLLQHYAASSLWCALQNTDADSAKVIVEQIEAETLQDLKRLWTKYLREDYASYQRSFKGESDVIDNVSEQVEPQRKFSRRTVKRKRKKSGTVFELEGTPLEPLRNMETLALFEQFLSSECGELSEEALSYQLWRAVTLCLAQKNKEKRETMALNIQQKFIYTDSDHHVELTGSQLELLDPMQEVERPDTPTLLAIQASAGNTLAKVVERYLIEEGEMKDGVGSLMNMDNRQKMSLPNKLPIGFCVRDEAQHLSDILEHNSSGPVSHQLKAFAKYLEEHAPLSQRNTLLNNVQFWLEVKKFNNMYLSGTNTQVLLSKGEALIDKYLDTTTPPWVKVTIPAELAVQVVSAASDLAKVKVPNHVNRLNDLLGRSQRAVFVDMLPYWGKFCQQYVAPDGSTISLPPVTSCVPLRGNTGTRSSVSMLRLPPIAKRDRTPLLSYSKHKGVQWKFSVHHD